MGEWLLVGRCFGADLLFEAKILLQEMWDEVAALVFVRADSACDHAPAMKLKFVKSTIFSTQECSKQHDEAETLRGRLLVFAISCCYMNLN